MSDARRELEQACERPLPALGGGDTAGRWRGLFELARIGPVDLARLAEAHHDARSILAEAAAEPRPAALYGVWASEVPGDPLVLDRSAGTLTGTKRFCSGLGLVDRALVTAVADDDRAAGPWLVEVALAPASTLSYDLGGWHTPALAATATGAIVLDRHPCDRTLGGVGWYLDRPGFWHGAIGPAACWAGAAAGLADAAEASGAGEPPDPHRLAALGALRAEVHLLGALLEDAGRRTDRELAGPEAADAAPARRRAYAVRHLVERSTARLADRFGRAFGPRPYVSDAAIARRAADLHLYTRQEHGERDLARLGALDR